MVQLLLSPDLAALRRTWEITLVAASIAAHDHVLRGGGTR
jgi:hypothetical protein